MRMSQLSLALLVVAHDLLRRVNLNTASSSGKRRAECVSSWLRFSAVIDVKYREGADRDVSHRDGLSRYVLAYHGVASVSDH